MRSFSLQFGYFVLVAVDSVVLGGMRWDEMGRGSVVCMRYIHNDGLYECMVGFFVLCPWDYSLFGSGVSVVMK